MRQQILVQFKGDGITTDYQIDESISHVTFVKNGVQWETVAFLSAAYTYGNVGTGPFCVWEAGQLRATELVPQNEKTVTG